MKIVSDETPRDGLGPDCYVCRYSERIIPGETQLKCNNPRSAWELGITCKHTGVLEKQFDWPHNFEPVWLLQCSGFEERSKEREMKNNNDPDAFDEFMEGAREVIHDFREWWGSREFWAGAKIMFVMAVAIWSFMFVIFMGTRFLLDWGDSGIVEAGVRFAERNPFW